MFYRVLNKSVFAPTLYGCFIYRQLLPSLIQYILHGGDHSQTFLQTKLKMGDEKSLSWRKLPTT